jgi:RNA polymerase sigma-70 factor (ECF subfamily)
MSPSAEMIAIVQPLIPALRRYARALLRDKDDADDLVQDVLERVTIHWHRRRQSESVRAWLFAILHNLAIDRLRRRTRNGRVASLDTVADAQLAAPPQQEIAMEQQRLLSLFGLLPEDQRSVLLLVGVEELSYAEAADVLGVPLGTVMSRLSRGRERLRRLVEDGAAGTQPVLRIVS